LAVTLLAAACGRPSAPDRAPSGGASRDVPGEQRRPDAGAAEKVLPSVPVLDVASGGTVDLAGLIPADRPTLLWFWAPH
jgi:hypothetical protein